MTHDLHERVVITGVGGWSCLAGSFSETWKLLLQQRKGAATTIKKFDAKGFPTSIACEALPGIDNQHPDIAKLVVSAATEGLKSAGLERDVLDAHRCQWFLGLGMGTPELDWYCDVVLKEMNEPSAYLTFLKQVPSSIAAQICRDLEVECPVNVIHTACASSAQAVGEAFLALRTGELDICLAGGADNMVQPFQLAGFSLLGALSRQNRNPAEASRPFTSQRDGLVIGEGSCVLIMETLTSARNRNASIFAEVVGYGCTESAFRITDLHPEGRGIREAIASALSMGGVEPEEVNYINAHGTSTLPNDQVEADVIGGLFPESTLVSSTKSFLGHTIAAAGAIEAGLCAMALYNQIIPHSLFRHEQDQRCRVTLTAEEPSSQNFKFALSNSIGFGGSNAALLFKRWGEDG